jgi:hypothetical protein
MAVTNPEWLSKRGAELRPSADGRSWVVFFDGGPQYLLVPVPAKGAFACRVAQTINGRRLDRGGTFPSVEAAVAGGLDDLRQALGW